MTARARALVEIGDRHYEMDVSKYARRPLAAVREQVDQGREPGEGSLASAALWSRTGRDFVLGSGQEFYDEEDSSRLRFWTSTGIDPWDRRALQLLHAAQLKRTSAEAIQSVFTTTVLWHVAGATLASSPDGVTFTAVTGLSGTALSGWTTDGTAVYATDGSTVYKVTGTTAASFCTTDLDVVGYANGHLLAGKDHTLYEINGAGSATSLFAHPSAAGDWGNITAAPNGIYLTHSAGDRSTIYYVGVDEADGTLVAPVAVGSTFTVHALLHASAVLAIGTDIGIQLARINASTNSLAIGPTVLIDQPVRGFTFDGFFLWYTRTRTAEVSGLGRLNPARFTTEDLVAAYADDLAGSATGVVQGVATFLGQRWFTIAGVGLHGETDDYVASGTYRSGWVSYGIAERKSVAGLEVKHLTLPTAASIEGQIIEEDETTTTVLTSVAGLGRAAAVEGIEGEAVSVAIVINRGADTTITPVVRRWTLRSIPQPYRSEELFLPLRLADQVSVLGHDVAFDSSDDWRYLKSLELSRERVTSRVGGEELVVFVDAVAIDPGDGYEWNHARSAVDALVTVKLVTVDVGA